MVTVEVDKQTVDELANFKLRNIQTEISNILEKWNIDSIEDFLAKAKIGELVESENDAIDIRQLVIEEKKILKLLSQIKG